MHQKHFYSIKAGWGGGVTRSQRQTDVNIWITVSKSSCFPCWSLQICSVQIQTNEQKEMHTKLITCNYYYYNDNCIALSKYSTGLSVTAFIIKYRETIGAEGEAGEEREQS